MKGKKLSSAATALLMFGMGMGAGHPAPPPIVLPKPTPEESDERVTRAWKKRLKRRARRLGLPLLPEELDEMSKTEDPEAAFNAWRRQLL